ncbi:MAG: hypothetical protein LBI61_04050 [Puniceicoccales bacterium]|jgi:hypothetical protein|nr:hypothetical protein [Puniceicoccales bacterium]
MSIARIFTLVVCALAFRVCSIAVASGASNGDSGEYAFRIKSVEIKHMGDANFKTIGEYFGEKKEHRYFRCIARDAENKRAGTYFIIGLNVPVSKLPGELFAKIYAVMAMEDGVRTFTCKIPEERKFPFVYEIYCGVVSEKIDIQKIRAWKIEFEDGEGNVLFGKKSYMWEL